MIDKICERGDNLENILNEDILKYNLNFAALFVLNYECLKEYVINQVRDFYSDNIYFDGNKGVVEESVNYKKKVRLLDGSIENASLKWFVKCKAITQDEYEIYQKIRKRRNDITHELLKNLINGFDEDDVKLFLNLLDIYSKIDKWWINEIEIPISGDEITYDYDKANVCGGQAIILSVINDIILKKEESRYKEMLNEIMERWNVR